MTMYRLRLLGPTGEIAKVRRFWANTDEGALAMARQMLSDDPTSMGLELWTALGWSLKSASERALPARTMREKREAIEKLRYA